MILTFERDSCSQELIRHIPVLDRGAERPVVPCPVHELGAVRVGRASRAGLPDLPHSRGLVDDLSTGPWVAKGVVDGHVHECSGRAGEMGKRSDGQENKRESI